MTFGPPARFMEMIHSYNARRVVSHVVALFAIFLLALGFTTAAHPQSARTSKKFQNYLVPRRSIQIHDGFGINSDLPRDPTFLGTAGGGRASSTPVSVSSASVSMK